MTHLGELKKNNYGESCRDLEEEKAHTYLYEGIGNKKGRIIGYSA